MRMKKLLSMLFIGIIAYTSSATVSVPYYTVDFSESGTGTLEELGFTVLDANKDKTKWERRSSSITFRTLDGESLDEPIVCYPAQIEKSNMDDWLITPSIKFETGKTYKATFQVAKYLFAAHPDIFEIKMGSDKTVESMTTTLIEKTTLPEKGGNTLWTYSVEISTPSTGDYYIGIHATGQNIGALGLAKLTIEQGVSLATPVAVTDLKVTPDPSGAKSANIEFTTPSKAKNGSDLTALTKVEILRDQNVVHTIEAPAVNSKQQWTDNNIAVNGEYSYSVIAYSEGGQGDISEPVTVFVGVNKPAPARNVVAVHDGDSRSARVSWEAPSTDKDGNNINPELISYDVARYVLYEESSTKTVIAKNLKECTISDRLPEDDPNQPAPLQQFYVYEVTAKTSEGTGEEATAMQIPMGPAYKVPYSESFENGHPSGLFSSYQESEVSAYWSQARDYDDIASVDGDYGLEYLNGRQGGASSAMLGLVDLSGYESPTLSYYTWNQTGCEPEDNTMQVIVTATDGTTKTFDEYIPANGWEKKIILLDEFKDKTIFVRLLGRKNNNVTAILLDNISFSNIFPYDLKLTEVSVPASARTDQEFELTAKIVNFGIETIPAFTVKLIRDGQEIDEATYENLAAGVYQDVVFKETLNITSPSEVEYTFVIDYEADQDPDNNSGTAKVTVVKPSYPTVSDLTGTFNDGTVTLTWGEPDTSKAQPYPFTETFDEYDSWTNSNVGEWIFADLDKAQIAGFQGITMPGIDNYSQQSWWVFDNSYEGFDNGSFSTLSGHKFLASMISGVKGEGRTVQNDDWAISPELFGGAQTIEVNARSYDAIDLESFEVLYSEGSTSTDDFKSLKVFNEVPNQWTSYQIELPDGAGRFAIRNISNGKLMLMIDNVTFIPKGDAASFSINGYNIYRDGEKINDAPIEENTFADSDAGNGNHDYTVTVLYSVGESMFSNVFNPSVSGIDTTEYANTAVYGGNGFISITNPSNQPATIMSIDGRIITVSSEPIIPVSCGIYIVKIGTEVHKVYVK